MTEKEIKIALENVIQQYGVDCYQCKYKLICRDKMCPFRTSEYALNLINQYENEIDRLKAQIAVYEGWGNKL